MDVKAKYCFEVSWEVCNKVGGIYTVVSSKALQMLNKYGNENFFFIGPYFPKKAYGIFVEQVAEGAFAEVFEALKKEGIVCHFGEWLIKGNPKVILIDFSQYTKNKDNIKQELWRLNKIDSLYTEYHDFDEPVIWSWAAGRLLKELSERIKDPIVAQFHEWLSGSGVLYLKSQNANIATVFTTHATMLGRTLATANINIYEQKDLNPEQEARNRGVLPKFQMEQQCATNAHVFTTVSGITGLEAEKLLGKKPDVILPNGLDMDKFPTFEETSNKHVLYKTKIRTFCLYYFFPYYSFDLENTLFFFIAGRYEFHDKGIDIYIRALAKLNNRLKKEKSKRNVVAFIWVPGNIRGIKPDLLHTRTLFRDVAEAIHDEMDPIQHRITRTLISKQQISKETLFPKDLLQDLKRKLLRLVKKGTPPLSTHDLHNEQSDMILQTLYATGLDNKEDDNVKAVYYPIYLTGADGLLDTSYYESMLGCHLGIFPSFYEPWGYTPLEAGALGVASITTDLAGFGRYICAECEQKDNTGIYVLRRMGVPDEKVTEELAERMYVFLNLSKRDRIENKINARRLADTCDWKFFIENYIKAHNLALEKLNQQG